MLYIKFNKFYFLFFKHYIPLNFLINFIKFFNKYIINILMNIKKLVIKR